MKKNVRPPAARQRLQANAKAVKVNSPRNLTPALCDRLRLDLLNACRKVAETHGLTVEGGALSDIDLRHGFDIEFSVGIPMDDGSLYSVDRALFEVLAEPFGLKPSDYGRIFRTGGETFRITAINPNRPKYPISAERLADGRGYKFTVENIGSAPGRGVIPTLARAEWSLARSSGEVRAGCWAAMDVLR